jgi:membrane associated rhomboid family serine protease
MLGQGIWLILFFVGGIVAALPAFIKHKNQIGYQSVGASGAISALLMAFMILFPQSEIAFFMILPMPSWIGALVFLGLEHYLSKKSQSNIAHDAHFWGAIAGIAIISCWNYEFTLDFIFYVFHDIQSWIK